MTDAAKIARGLTKAQRGATVCILDDAKEQ